MIILIKLWSDLDVAGDGWQLLITQTWSCHQVPAFWEWVSESMEDIAGRRMLSRVRVSKS